MDLPEKPKLRPVDVFPVDLAPGDQRIVLRDTLGVTEGVLAVPPAMAQLFLLLDGTRTVEDVQAEWAKRTGELVPAAMVERLVRTLDEHLYLEGERFERAWKEVGDRFRAATVRPAALAGGAYPKEPDELRRFLGELWTREGGPGRFAASTSTSTSRKLKAIVAPHIDPTRGNTAYAWAFEEVAKAGPADLYVIFGTAHQGGDDLYIFTRKAFETPLGRAPTDAALVERLERRVGRPLDGAELSHRTEHSIEFEVLFLQYVHERLGAPPPRIVPFLCGTFQPFTETGRSPAARADVAATVEALRAEIAAEEGRGARVVSIAAADLAHIGPKFRTRFADAAFRRECEEKDRASLERALAPSGEGFFDFIAAEKDARNICGLPCTYTMLKVIEAGVSRGSLLAYGQADDPVAGSVVSFASAAYYE